MSENVRSEARFRIPNPQNWPADSLNRIRCGDSLGYLQQLPDECVGLAVTSPPYWDVIDYGVEGQIGPGDYEGYINDLLQIWRETSRVLIPNGKLAIVTPIMPIPKSVIGDQHTRHLKNIGADIEHSILNGVKGLRRFSFFIWQKQTTTKMFGSYPFPPNIYEDNTIESINVYVKDGPPPHISKEAKEPSKLAQEEWRNLTMQVWPMYPADVKRAGGHPAPYPVVLPQRLIMMYTFARAPEAGFEGDIVLDMFNGTGASTLAARALARNWIGFDLSADFCNIAESRTVNEPVDCHAIMLEGQRVRNPMNSQQQQLF